MRWVLGETSSRQLRAAGKMEDVIFGGTRRRGAMGFAMVRLTLDNSAHTLDIDADEAVIGRKYYRSGESEYTINGQVCRLKDIYELLLDTGIGRDGYSVIGQGRIAEIVAAKSSERREIFEEACGIAKYRYRRNEAERRLAAAAENLERLRDILGELEARVGPLEKESEKAQRFLELSARRKTLEVTLWTDEPQRPEIGHCLAQQLNTKPLSPVRFFNAVQGNPAMPLFLFFFRVKLHHTHSFFSQETHQCRTLASLIQQYLFIPSPLFPHIRPGRPHTLGQKSRLFGQLQMLKIQPRLQAAGATANRLALRKTRIGEMAAVVSKHYPQRISLRLNERNRCVVPVGGLA